MVEELLEAVPMEHVITVALESNDYVAALVVHDAECTRAFRALLIVSECLVSLPCL